MIKIQDGLIFKGKNLCQLDETWWEWEGRRELDKVVYQVVELVGGAWVGEVKEEVLDQAQFWWGTWFAEQS